MTKRSRGVSNTRWSAIVNSTTPRFGPRWPPVWERTRINSSRTSCASSGRSCSRRAFMSAGERIPSSKRFGAVDIVVSEESNFVIFCFLFFRRLIFDVCFRRCRFEIFHHRLAGAVAGNDLDLLFGTGKSFLANFYQVHSFFVANNQVLQRQFP